MPVDPQAQQVLDLGKLLPPMETLSVKAARNRCRDAFCTTTVFDPVEKLQDLTIDLVIDHTLYKVPVRIYTPHSRSLLPILVYFHGGGFVVNNLETHDAICRNLAINAECVVVSVDYARAPEFQYPIAVRQCYGITDWVEKNAEVIGGDPTRIAVGGDSSGGMLAAVVSLMARDRNGPHICCQLLLYPALDYYLPGTFSYQEFSTGYSLTRNTMKWFFGHYLPKEFDLNDAYLFPAMAKSHENLPHAFIITAEYDPLRDEAEQYATALEKAGTLVTVKRYDGMIHGFIIMHRAIDKGKVALKDAGNFLKKTFMDGY